MQAKRDSAKSYFYLSMPMFLLANTASPTTWYGPSPIVVVLLISPNGELYLMKATDCWSLSGNISVEHRTVISYERVVFSSAEL